MHVFPQSWIKLLSEVATKKGEGCAGDIANLFPKV
jgi:hypothetical protein